MRQRVRTIKAGTFAEVIRAYLSSPKFDALAWATRDSYSRFLRMAELPETLGTVDVEEIRPALVQAFLDGLADRPASQRNAKSALKAVEKWAIVRDMLQYPITTGTEIVGSGDGHEPWTDAEVAYAEQHARLHIARAITLAANTGQRGSDLVRMRWSDIEEYDGRLGINVRQKKTDVRLWIPMTQELQRTIATWERRPTFLLLKEDGQPWTREQLSCAWFVEREREVMARLADRVLHGLRATACVRLRRAGASLPHIGDMVGMSQQMVSRYCRHSVQRENALAAVHYLDRTKPEQPKTNSKFSKG